MNMEEAQDDATAILVAVGIPAVEANRYLKEADGNVETAIEHWENQVHEDQNAPSSQQTNDAEVMREASEYFDDISDMSVDLEDVFSDACSSSTGGSWDEKIVEPVLYSPFTSKNQRKESVPPRVSSFKDTGVVWGASPQSSFDEQLKLAMALSLSEQREQQPQIQPQQPAQLQPQQQQQQLGAQQSQLHGARHSRFTFNNSREEDEEDVRASMLRGFQSLKDKERELQQRMQRQLDLKQQKRQEAVSLLQYRKAVRDRGTRLVAAATAVPSPFPSSREEAGGQLIGPPKPAFMMDDDLADLPNNPTTRLVPMKRGLQLSRGSGGVPSASLSSSGQLQVQQQSWQMPWKKQKTQGNDLATPQERTYACPLCRQDGLREMEMLPHVLQYHSDLTSHPARLVCPICAVRPGGNPGYKSRDFYGHLDLRHKPRPQPLKNSGGRGYPGVVPFAVQPTPPRVPTTAGRWAGRTRATKNIAEGNEEGSEEGKKPRVSGRKGKGETLEEEAPKQKKKTDIASYFAPKTQHTTKKKKESGRKAAEERERQRREQEEERERERKREKQERKLKQKTASVFIKRRLTRDDNGDEGGLSGPFAHAGFVLTPVPASGGIVPVPRQRWGGGGRGNSSTEEETDALLAYLLEMEATNDAVRHGKTSAVGYIGAPAPHASAKRCDSCSRRVKKNQTRDIFPCGHTFHSSCVDGYNEVEGGIMVAACPLCR